MIKSLTVTNYLGKKLTMVLSKPESSGLLIRSISGLGPVKADINTTDYASSDGVLFNSARIGSRNIVIALLYLFKPTIEDARRITYTFFQVKKNIRLTIETDTTTVFTDGYVESNEPDMFSSLTGAQISIICPDPSFYSESYTLTTFSGLQDLLEFPLENDSLTEPMIELGNIFNDTIKVINYQGDIEVGMSIMIHALADVTSITIYNVDTRERLALDMTKLGESLESKMKAFDDLMICTIPGQKAVTLLREGKTYNALNCLDRTSSWLKLAKGDNVFAYIVAEGADSVVFRVENFIAYEGI